MEKKSTAKRKQGKSPAKKAKRPKNLKDKQVRGKVLQRTGTVLAHLGKFSLYAYAATNASTTINTL